MRRGVTTCRVDTAHNDCDWPVRHPRLFLLISSNFLPQFVNLSVRMYQLSSQHQHKDSQMSEKERFERQIYLPLKKIITTKDEEVKVPAFYLLAGTTYKTPGHDLTVIITYCVMWVCININSDNDVSHLCMLRHSLNLALALQNTCPGRLPLTLIITKACHNNDTNDSTMFHLITWCKNTSLTWIYNHSNNVSFCCSLTHRGSSQQMALDIWFV